VSRSRALPGGQGARLVLALIGVLAIGFALAALLVPVSAPPGISGTPSKLSAPVTAEDVLDAVAVNLDVSTTPAAPVLTSATGIVTENLCSAGTSIASGSKVAAVNGQPLVALATAKPFWRDVRMGDTGADVSDIQGALKALGYPVSITGRFDRATLRGVIQLATNAGAEAAGRWNAFSTSQFVWIPSATVVPLTCGLSLGASIGPGTTFATLPPVVASARLESIPSTAVPGHRVVKVGSLTLPVSEDGSITGQSNLLALGQSDEYRAFLASQSAQNSATQGSNASVDGGASGVAATYQLAKAVHVTALSPAALYDQTGQKACVQSGDRAIPVTVVGSQLGESYVTLPPGTSIRQVRLNVIGGAPCR